MKSVWRWNRTLMALAVLPIYLGFAGGAGAQVQTSTTTASGQPSKEVTVEHAEVVAVEGNDLFVKMADGSIRHIPNVSESAKITVDGQQVGIHDLKPGMKLQRTITTTTTPQVVTTVQTVSGRVFHVNAPNSVILTMEDGTNQRFQIPAGQKFTINGQETDAFGLRRGMNVTATKIVEEPITMVEHQQHVTGQMPPPPEPPPANVPVLIVMTTRVPAPATTETASAAEMPKTASDLPWIGLLGFLSLSVAFVIRMIRS